MAKVKFFEKKVKVKVKVTELKILVLTEKLQGHKEYTCVILKLYLLLLKSYGQG